MSLSRALAELFKVIREEANANPDFKPGGVLSAKDLERMRPFIPPGYLEQLSFPEFRAPK